MLPLEDMTQGDAQHTLQVYEWITAHLPEITVLAQQPQRDVVTACEAQKRFHRTYTELTCTRFLPATLTLFTDEDTLYGGEQREPNVLLSQPGDRDEYVVVDYLHSLDLATVARRFGIAGDERTWRLSGK